MSILLLPVGSDGQAFNDANGAPRSGAKLFVYLANTSTKATIYQDQGAAANHANPIILNSSGQVSNGSAVKPIFADSGQTFDVVLAPSSDTDPPASPYFTLEDISLVNDSAISSITEWVEGTTPTYVSATQLTLVGNQTSTYTVGRRIKTENTGGTIYSTITVSAYTSLTTITVVNDSGTLDSGLSAIYYGLLSTNSSIPGIKLSNQNWAFSGTLTMSGKSIWDAEGANVASAADCNIWTTDGNTVHITGTTAVADWGTAPQAGASKWCTNDSALTLTYNATTNVLPGDADIALPANSWFEVYAKSTSTYEVRQIQFSDGRSLGLVSGTVTATTSGTSHGYTSIPPWAKRITMSLAEVSLSGTDHLLIQIGISSGYETTGYVGTSIVINDASASAGASSTVGFPIYTALATRVSSGHAVLTLLNSATNLWSMSFHGKADANNVIISGGSKALSGVLDRIQIRSTTTDTFDGGSLNIMWE